eukprot:1157851-Pelagomonas_calceolata.AAC.2
MEKKREELIQSPHALMFQGKGMPSAYTLRTQPKGQQNSWCPGGGKKVKGTPGQPKDKPSLQKSYFPYISRTIRKRHARGIATPSIRTSYLPLIPSCCPPTSVSFQISALPPSSHIAFLQPGSAELPELHQKRTLNSTQSKAMQGSTLAWHSLKHKGVNHLQPASCQNYILRNVVQRRMFISSTLCTRRSEDNQGKKLRFFAPALPFTPSLLHGLSPMESTHIHCMLRPSCWHHLQSGGACLLHGQAPQHEPSEFQQSAHVGARLPCYVLLATDHHDFGSLGPHLRLTRATQRSQHGAHEAGIEACRWYGEGVHSHATPSECQGKLYAGRPQCQASGQEVHWRRSQQQGSQNDGKPLWQVWASFFSDLAQEERDTDCHKVPHCRLSDWQKDPAGQRS